MRKIQILPPHLAQDPRPPAEIKIVVGLSGGVDSSVAALLLKNQGYQVIGLFMKNWEEESPYCQAAADFEDVSHVCQKIGIPYYSLNLSKEYWDRVFVQFLEGIKAGRTPNPDILCNREIKFQVFLEKAKLLGADYLATGHYAQVGPQLQLLKGLDPQKDQSYFLYTLSEQILSQVLFPIGHLPKQQVRALAREFGLSTHNKKDSTGICFIGERPFSEFLGQYIQAQKGPFQRLNGEIVGEHRGMAFYTLGQRKGLGLGGAGEAWFVVAKDPLNNIVYVERGKDHGALYVDELWVRECSWVSAPPSSHLSCKAKIRYRQQDQECEIREETLSATGEKLLHVVFKHPQRAATPEQSIVFYQGDVCLGGGLIAELGANYRQMGKVPLPEESL